MESSPAPLFFHNAHSKDDLDKIYENPTIYLGSYTPAMDLDSLELRGITHILCAGSFMRPAFPDDFQYLTVDVHDSPDQDISQFFDEAYDFIEKANKSKGTIFIHCAAGISRSTTLACAYLMKKFHKPFSHILAKI